MFYKDGRLQIFNLNGKKLMNVECCDVGSVLDLKSNKRLFSAIRLSGDGFYNTSYSVWPFATLPAYVFTGVEVETDENIEPVTSLLENENAVEHKKSGLIFMNDEIIHEGDFWVYSIDRKDVSNTEKQLHIYFIKNNELNVIKLSENMLNVVVSVIEQKFDVPEVEIIKS